MERVQKVIARTGIASRRTAERWISEGRVTVDGVVVGLGARAEPRTQRLAIDGVPLPVAPDQVAYLVNKPTGVVSTVKDPQGRPRVVDLVPKDPPVYPAGRLDLDSAGLLILTNDGDLASLVTHPRHGITKTYRVLVAGKITSESVGRLEAGVTLADGPARAVGAKIISRHADNTLLEIVMSEGRKREVRRMFDALGHPALELFRSAIGPIRDPDLQPGSFRRLTLNEIRRLYAAGR